MKVISSKIQALRHGIQILFIIFITNATRMHQGNNVKYPGIDAFCPFGGIETLYQLFAGGALLKRIMPSNIILLAALILLTLLLSRYFCGFICVLGSLQEFFAKLGQKIFKKAFIMPIKIDNYLRYLKYAVLIAILIWTWQAGELVFRPYDPFAAYAHIWSGLDLFEEFAVGGSVLIGSLIISMFYDRFFCKYLCPLGAFLGVLNKISFFRIKRDNSTCINCSICTKECPVNIPVAKIEAVTSSECINCLKCISACPTKKGTLNGYIFNKVLTPLTIIIAGIVIYMGSIFASEMAGKWKTVEPSLSEIKASSATTGKKLNVDDICEFSK